jgi:hypothetical protein
LNGGYVKKTLLVALMVGGALWMVTGCGQKNSDAQKQDVAQQTTTQEAAKPAEVAQTQPQATQPAAEPQEQKKVSTPAVPREKKLTIPDSTAILVNLVDSVQTNENQVGDHFRGTIAQAVEVGGKTVIPQGSEVDMVITKLVKGGTLKTSPEIGFTIDKVTLPGGHSLKVATAEFYEKGRSHTGREVGMIGGGAAAGAIIGAIAGKGKGAAIGAATGAAAGTGLAAATGRQNLVYGPGKSVTFTTSAPVTVTVPAK